MILLDTNYLIRALVRGSAESLKIRKWIMNGTELITSSIVWYEFLSGPVDSKGIETVAALIVDRIIPYTSDTAREAARLWNASGRKRGLRIDAMIAATTIISNAKLATENKADFKAFTMYGLTLIGE